MAYTCRHGRRIQQDFSECDKCQKAFVRDNMERIAAEKPESRAGKRKRERDYNRRFWENARKS